MSISLRETMNGAPIGRLQWTIGIMLTCVMVLEGIDFQIAAYSAPALMSLWGLSKLQLAPLLAAAMIGMAVGTLIGSWTGDRYGRKPTLVVSVAFFGLMTIVSGWAEDPRQFMMFRFISGLGFGAAFPVAIAMMGEWMPRRAAGKAISIMTIGIPVGVLSGALVASWFLPSFGWRWFFSAVGAVCMVSSGFLAFSAPESPAYLILKGHHEKVHALLQRAWHRPIGNGLDLFHLEQISKNKEGLFGRGHTRTNVGLWIAYLAAGLATYTMAAWLTVVLTGLDLPLTTALKGPMIYSFSAILGALTIGWVISGLGSRTAMLLLGCLCIVSSLAMSVAVGTLTPDSTMFTIIFVGLSIDGFCIGSLIAAGLVVATRAYETDIRARGIGVMTAIARVGSILSSFLGGAVLSASLGGGFFALIAFLMLTVVVGVLVIDRHAAKTPAVGHKVVDLPPEFSQSQRATGA